MALASHGAVLIEENSLERLRCGYGGFGSVYKAKHKVFKTAVAIKFLHHGPCMLEPSALLREAISMKKLACPFVVRFYDIYECCPPGTSSVQQGIVMEFMEGGTIDSLQRDLPGPPPWPLAFRFALEVARGMNFLHSMGFVHQDLKPSNVLLGKYFNAKIADFGLCRVSTSVLTTSIETPEVKGGTFKYMPPEAFKKPYEPVRSFDIYSYGILLWSIITGEEPYPGVAGRAVEVFQNTIWEAPTEISRPPVEKIDQSTAEGLGDLVDLMKRCWQGEPSRRPNFEECIEDTANVFEKHEMGILDAVVEVSKKLSPATNHQLPKASRPRDLSNVHPQPAEQLEDTVDFPRFKEAEGSSKKESVDSFAVKMSDEAKAAFVTEKRSKLVQQLTRVMLIVDELGDLVASEDYDNIRAAKPDQKKVRELYRLCFRSGEVKVKAAFYDALKKHQAGLIEMLDG